MLLKISIYFKERCIGKCVSTCLNEFEEAGKEGHSTDSFGMRYWRKFLRISWTA